MKKLSLLFFICILSISGTNAQQSVSWNSSSDNGNWWNGTTGNTLHWIRSCDGYWIKRPDYNTCKSSSTNIGPNNIIFDNNTQLSMNVNGAWFQINELTFSANASSGRTLTADQNGGLSFKGSNSYITNNSTATHIFSTGISVDGSSLTINAAGGSLTFNNPININANSLIFSGNSNVTVNGVLSGTGTLTQNAASTLTFTVANTYTGTTTVTSGTLELKNSLASSTITVKTGATLKISENATINNLIVESGGTLTIVAEKTLTINAGKQVTINGTVNYNSTGKIKLLSDVNGTATLTGSYSGPAEVQQYLTGDGRNWWYLSSPVSDATSDVIAPTSSTNKIGEYFENYIESPIDNASTTAPYYSLPFTAGSAKALTVGKGYVIKFSDTNAKTVTFTGGSLNTGDVSPSVTRTGTTAAKRGFNLVGNPYPSYLDWDAVYTSLPTNHNMRNAIWFRTYSGGNMTFHTYGDGDGVPVDLATKWIAPMQAFWVKVDKDNTAASLTFKNTHRSHFVTGANPLKVKALDARPRLRLVVSNGAATDELLVVGKSYASDVLDSYDIEKFSNDNVAIPEIYSVVSGQELVINSMNELTEGKTVTLGFRPGQAGTFTIETTQLENIDAKVVLVDKVAVKEQELTAETPYTFASDETPTNDRFLIKLVSKVPTGVENTAATGDLTVYVNRNNRIQLISGIELNDQATVSVYNVAGQKLSTQKLSKSATELNGTYNPGVYMIQLTNGSQAITKKLIIR